MSDKSPASRMLLTLRAKKLMARKTGATPSPSHSSSDCAGVTPLLARQVKEEPGVTEEDHVTGPAPTNTSRSLQEAFENIKLEKSEDLKIHEEEQALERDKVYTEMMMAREKLTRAKNQKEMLRELYETRKRNNASKDWEGWSFEEMRDEYVRFFVKKADLEKNLYSSSKKRREIETTIGELQWTLDSIQDQVKALTSSSRNKKGMK